MDNEKTYITYKFTGLKPIESFFTQAGISTRIIKDESTDRLLADNELFNEGEDSIELGICSREGKDLYFIEFGISLDGAYKSFLTFLYDHHPTFDEMQATTKDIEYLIHENLVKVKAEMAA